MSLSGNIKRLRLERNMTQEQLAAKLGVSAQAVSKWETSETYPDGALLVTLSRELGASLDRLFDNDPNSMADVSAGIISLIGKTEERERFNVARDICWQIEKGLFNCCMPIDNKYDPNELSRRNASSYIFNDYGFTVVSNKKEPFFAVFPEPDGGFGDFIGEKEKLMKIFGALSRKDTVNALIYLYRRTQHYVFEACVLARECGIPEDRLQEVLEDLLTLKTVYAQDVELSGEKRTLYYSTPNHDLIALFLMAKEAVYSGSYEMNSHLRNKPLLRSE